MFPVRNVTRAKTSGRCFQSRASGRIP